MKSILLSLATLGMAATPIAASASSTAAYSSSGVRAASPTAQTSDLAGEGSGGLFAFALLAGIVAIVVIAVVNGEEDDDQPNSP